MPAFRSQKTLLTLAVALSAIAVHAHADSFNRIASFGVIHNLPEGTEQSQETSPEIIAASEDGNTLVYSDSPFEALGFVDITDAKKPVAGGIVKLDGEPTSVAITGQTVLAGVNTSESYSKPSGYLLALGLKERDELVRCDLGGQPDSVAVSKDGRYVAVAIENERDEDLNDGELPQLPAGWVTIVPVKNGLPQCDKMTKVDMTGLAEIGATDPEPEFVDINNLGEIVVTMQENNWMAVIDRNGKVISEFDAGLVTLEGIDNKKDGKLNMVDTIENVRREPDAVKWIGNDHFATANEGDYKHEAPGQAKRGGSRGWTIFNKNGSVVYESGSSYERALASTGYWPEKRAEKKGVEPESVEVAIYGDTRYIFVGAERANAIGVYKANDLSNPELVTILPTGIGPEGLVAIPERNLFISANEVDKEKSVTIYSLD